MFRHWFVVEFGTKMMEREERSMVADWLLSLGLDGGCGGATMGYLGNGERERQTGREGLFVMGSFGHYSMGFFGG